MGSACLWEFYGPDILLFSPAFICVQLVIPMLCGAWRAGIGGACLYSRCLGCQAANTPRV